MHSAWRQESAKTSGWHEPCLVLFFIICPCIPQSLGRWRPSAGANARRSFYSFLDAGDRAPPRTPGALAANYSAPAMAQSAEAAGCARWSAPRKPRRPGKLAQSRRPSGARRACRGFLGAGDRAPARRPGALASTLSAPATECRCPARLPRRLPGALSRCCLKEYPDRPGRGARGAVSRGALAQWRGAQRRAGRGARMGRGARGARQLGTRARGERGAARGARGARGVGREWRGWRTGSGARGGLIGASYRVPLPGALAAAAARRALPLLSKRIS